MKQLTKTQLKSFKLKVNKKFNRHAFISEESYADKAGLDFDDRYVYFSGYFGALGPEVFAKVPEMLILLQDLAGEDSLPEKYHKRIQRIIKKQQGARRTQQVKIKHSERGTTWKD